MVKYVPSFFFSTPPRLSYISAPDDVGIFNPTCVPTNDGDWRLMLTNTPPCANLAANTRITRCQRLTAYMYTFIWLDVVSNQCWPSLAFAGGVGPSNGSISV